MTLRRVVLLRHGRTVWNHERRMQGRLDPELDDVGRAQAAAVGAAMARFGPALVVASDQRRAWVTAEAAAAACGLTARPDPRLRETGLGEWEGLTGDEVEAGWPGGIDSWRADPRFAPPGGESRCDVAERALPVVRDLEAELADPPGTLGTPDTDATALLVAHGGAIVALTASILDWPVAVWPSLYPLPNCGWAVLDRRDHWRLVAWGAVV